MQTKPRRITIGFSGLGILLVTTLAIANEPRAANAVRLTSDGHLKRDPVVTANGEEIVYALLENPAQLRLMRLNVADGSTQPLHADVTKSEFEPALSPDGRYLAFIQSRGNLSLALVIRDREQNRDAEVPPGGGFSGMRSPAISPDAKRVLYAYPEEGRQHIYSVNIEAQDRKQLTDSNGVNNWPSYAPDGRQVVFGSTRDGNYDIYLMQADGSEVRRLTENRFQDIRPRFSPDGKRIAFTSSRDGNYEIYVMNADGSGVTRVTNHPERDDYPAWHPDGKRLVVVSERDGAFDLYRVDAP
jgi:Tol biopolymer transport system component